MTPNWASTMLIFSPVSIIQLLIPTFPEGKADTFYGLGLLFGERYLYAQPVQALSVLAQLRSIRGRVPLAGSTIPLVLALIKIGLDRRERLLGGMIWIYHTRATGGGGTEKGDDGEFHSWMSSS